MPLYEYACRSCEKETEVIQAVGEKPLKICPHCGGKLRKVFSAPAIQFKGSGWYVTDYGKGGGSGKKADSGEKGETAEKAGKGETAEKPEKTEKKKEKKAKE